MELLCAAVLDAHGGEPNAGHVAIAALERGGFVDAVVTQNIDLLQDRPGVTAVAGASFGQR